MNLHLKEQVKVNNFKKLVKYKDFIQTALNYMHLIKLRIKLIINLLIIKIYIKIKIEDHIQQIGLEVILIKLEVLQN